jgi:hypothetical protein
MQTMIEEEGSLNKDEAKVWVNFEAHNFPI